MQSPSAVLILSALRRPVQTMLAALATAGFLWVGAQPVAWAQGPALTAAPAVTSKLTAQRVEMIDGKAVFKPATDGKPGQVIEYVGTYKNNSKSAINKLLATLPVPVGTTYVAGSAEPSLAVQASVDGVRFAPAPLMRRIRAADGTERREPVPLSDYRALRWEIATLPADGSTEIKMRVSIDSFAGKSSDATIANMANVVATANLVAPAGAVVKPAAKP